MISTDMIVQYKDHLCVKTLLLSYYIVTILQCIAKLSDQIRRLFIHEVNIVWINKILEKLTILVLINYLLTVSLISGLLHFFMYLFSN